MTVCAPVTKLFDRVYDHFQLKQSKQELPKMEISAPYNFRHVEGALLPGVSADEMSLMKEKALASVAASAASEESLPPPRPSLGRRMVYHARKSSLGRRLVVDVEGGQI